MANLMYPCTLAAIVVTLLCPLVLLVCNLAHATDSPLNDALVPRLNAREDTDACVAHFAGVDFVPRVGAVRGDAETKVADTDAIFASTTWLCTPNK